METTALLLAGLGVLVAIAPTNRRHLALAALPVLAVVLWQLSQLHRAAAKGGITGDWLPLLLIYVALIAGMAAASWGITEHSKKFQLRKLIALLCWSPLLFKSLLACAWHGSTPELERAVSILLLAYLLGFGWRRHAHLD